MSLTHLAMKVTDKYYKKDDKIINSKLRKVLIYKALRGIKNVIF